MEHLGSCSCCLSSQLLGFCRKHVAEKKTSIREEKKASSIRAGSREIDKLVGQFNVCVRAIDFDQDWILIKKKTHLLNLG